jgi:hypothetical protein
MYLTVQMAALSEETASAACAAASKMSKHDPTQRHPRGSKARLALELLLQTGTARCDMVRIGRQHVKNGTLSMRRLKTNVAFDIPLLPTLVTELELHPKDQLTFLMTEWL